jgi:GTP-binding protein SAR1
MGLWDLFFRLLGWLGLHEKTGTIIFLGLDNSGKTTLLRLLAGGKLAMHSPTVHPTNEELRVGGVRFSAHDLGGHEQTRRLWKDYYAAVDAVVFIIDTADRERAAEARTELMGLLAAEELRDTVFLVLGNKTDIEGAMDEREVRDFFHIQDTDDGGGDGAAGADAAGRAMHLSMCCLVRGARGEGYEEGFRWLGERL